MVAIETSLISIHVHCLTRNLILGNVQATTIKLYKFDESSNLWELEAASVNPNFFNANEDSAAAKPKW